MSDERRRLLSDFTPQARSNIRWGATKIALAVLLVLASLAIVVAG